MNRLERFKVWTILPREPLKLLMYFAGTVTLCCIAFAAYQGAMWMSEARHETAARWTQVESATGLLEAHMPAWVASIDKTLANLESTSANANEATADIKKRTPEIISSFTGVGVEGAALIANARPLINQNLDTLNANQLKLGEAITVTRDGLSEIIAKLVATGENVRVISDDPDLKSLPAELRRFTQSVNRTAGTLEVVAVDAHNVGVEMTGATHSINLMAADAQKKTNALLNPPPAPWWRKYLLQPIQTFGGATYLIVKIANGL